MKYTKKTKLRVISDSDVPFYPDVLKDFLLPEYNERKDNYEEIISDLWQSSYYPDYLMYDNERYSFVEHNGTIIFFGEVTKQIERLLIRFFQEDFKKYYTNLESSWNIFDGLINGIAYRGGKGYCYSIWNYKYNIV